MHTQLKGYFVRKIDFDKKCNSDSELVWQIHFFAFKVKNSPTHNTNY